MTSFLDGQAKYGVSASMTDLPLSLASSVSKRPISSEIASVQVPSQTGSQGANGNSTFLINAPRSYIKSGSVYMKCKVAHNATLGPGHVVFNSPCGLASAIFRNLTVYAGTYPIEQKLYSNIWRDILALHVGGRNFLNSDLGILENANPLNFTTPANSSIPVAGVIVCVALPLNTFLGEQDFPAFLIPNPLMITVEYDSIANSLYSASVTTQPSTMTISSALLGYEEIRMDSDYINSLKASMVANNIPYQIKIDQVGAVKFAKTQSQTYQFPVNASSVKAVIVTHVDEPTQTSESKAYIADATVNTDESLVLNILLDGKRVNQYQLNDLTTQYMELQKAFGVLGDVTQTFALGVDSRSTTFDNYRTVGYASGVNCNRFMENMALTGMSANNVTVEYTTAGNTAGCATYVFVVYNTILTISASGDVQLMR